MTTVCATINLSALRHNLQQVKSLATNSKLLAVIKADAYGHGLIEVAKALPNADGFALARLDEAIQLREAGIEHRLILLSGVLGSEDLQRCAELAIDVVVHSPELVELFLSTPLKQPVNLWLKLNTGMNRLGMHAEQFADAVAALENNTQVGELLLMTHFSASEQKNPEKTLQQSEHFASIAAPLPYPVSLTNSGAILQHPNSHGDWVRPGIMLYGLSPVAHQDDALVAAMTLTAKVLAIRTVNAGESVGYNSRWTASSKTKLATIGIGYGDGYPRHAKNGTPVIINGQRASLVGTVSMDLITVDISDCNNIKIGDEAELWGEQLSANEVAQWADTISYALFTGITARVEKRYVNP